LVELVCVKKAQNISDLPKQPFKTVGPFVAINVKKSAKIRPQVSPAALFFLVTLPKNWPVKNIEAHCFVNKGI
jgi:hypothetical protein